MSRPGVVVAVVGTGTEVGKTWMAAAVAVALRDRGLTVAARKPVQSYDPADPHPTDAQVLAGATGEDPAIVCSPELTLPVPMAPPMAADVLGRPRPSLDDLVAAVVWPDEVDVGLVETVGGVRSPVASDGDSRDLVDAVAADLVIVVADAGLGTIDSTRLAIDALADHDVVVALNRFDGAADLHDRNLRWLREVDGFEVCTGASAVAEGIARHASLERPERRSSG